MRHTTESSSREPSHPAKTLSEIAATFCATQARELPSRRDRGQAGPSERSGVFAR